MQAWPGFQLGEKVERRRSKPWAILLGIGYLVTIIYEWSTIRFTRGKNGLWTATADVEPDAWTAVLLLGFFLFSLICGVVFIANLLHERRGFDFAVLRRGVTGNDLLYFVAWIHLFQTVTILLFAFRPLPLFTAGSVGSLLESASLHLFILLLSLVWFKGRIGAIGFCKPKRPVWMLVSLLVLFLIIVAGLDAMVTNPVAERLQISLESEREQSIEAEILLAKATDWTAVLAAFAMIGIIVPIAEEILFRGVIQTHLVQRWGTLAGIFVSSLLFVLVHVDVALFAPLFAISLALGFLRHRFGTLWGSILLHSLNNLTSVLYYYL
jgi:membrane protease YdiL (CAAX protease family)